MLKQDGHWLLEPHDQIRLNQLVWPKLDKPGVRQWMGELLDEQIPKLVVEAHYFATQAGISEEVFREALESCPVPPPPQVAEELRRQSLTRDYHDRAFANSVHSADRSGKLAYIWLTLSLFAVATSRAKASGRTSPGWWNRDLHDPSVVKEVLRQEFGLSDA